MFTCPECREGKHQNCDGRAWDNAKDDYTPCNCAKPWGHPRRDSGGIDETGTLYNAGTRDS